MFAAYKSEPTTTPFVPYRYVVPGVLGRDPGGRPAQMFVPRVPYMKLYPSTDPIEGIAPA